MNWRKVARAIGIGSIVAMLGFILSGSELSWLLGILIAYLELKLTEED